LPGTVASGEDWVRSARYNKVKSAPRNAKMLAAESGGEVGTGDCLGSGWRRWNGDWSGCLLIYLIGPGHHDLLDFGVRTRPLSVVFVPY